MYPNNHIPVRLPKGTCRRLQSNSPAKRVPRYTTSAAWLLTYAPIISYN